MVTQKTKHWLSGRCIMVVIDSTECRSRLGKLRAQCALTSVRCYS